MSLFIVFTQLKDIMRLSLNLDIKLIQTQR